MTRRMTRRLILILGDQLTPRIAALDGADPARDVVLMAEVRAEAGYADHHKQKLALVFAAMRHFAAELRAAGWRVDYRPLTDDLPDLGRALADAVARHRPRMVIVTEPGEWRLWDAMQGWQAALGLPVLIRDDTRFLCSRDAFSNWAAGRKTLVMEHFYRHMRRQTGLLMAAGNPAGGRWNFDAENRQPPQDSLFCPRRRRARMIPSPPGCLTWSPANTPTISAVCAPSNGRSRAPGPRRRGMRFCAMPCPILAAIRMRCWPGGPGCITRFCRPI